MMKIPQHHTVPPDRAAILDGVRHVAADSFTSLFLVVVALLGVFAASYQTLIPVFADQAFSSTTALTGLLFAFAGGGSLTAAIALSSRYAQAVAGRLLAPAPWLCALAMGMMSFAATVPLAAAALYVLGFTLTLITATTNSSLQRTCPPQLRGALAGLYGMAFLGTLPLGHLLMGALASRYGMRPAFLAASLTLAAFLALLYLRKWRADGAIVGTML